MNPELLKEILETLKKIEKIEKIEKAKKFIFDKGSSVKMILDYVAIV